MGLGKTVQIVCMLEHFHTQENMKGPFLVVVPLSTIENWRRELEGWTHMRYCVYYDTGGGREMRDVIRAYEWRYPNSSTLMFSVLVTTYEVVAQDTAELAEIPWR